MKSSVVRSQWSVVCVGLLAALSLQSLGCGTGTTDNGRPTTNEVMSEDVIEALRVEGGVAVEDFDNAAWAKARPVRVRRYWSGEDAPEGKHAEARAVWTDEALVVRFVARQTEPLVVSESPRLDRKTLGLWDRDVCEIFVAPDASQPERYFEFEAAPTGEWVDLGIHWRPEGRETDWEYRSGMKAAARVREGEVTVAMSVPWAAFGRTPRAGEEWRANLFRCVGTDPLYRYLAWRPTYDPKPNIHVPQRFGRLAFKD